MAHTKAGGSTAQKGDRRGKHLGVKVTHGQRVNAGSILVKQKGATFKFGKGVRKGRDFTVYAAIEGIVEFKNKLGKKLVQVISS